MGDTEGQASAAYVNDFLKRQTHMTIAVTCPDGSPWAVPVHIQQLEHNVVEWESSVESVHSQAIALEPRIALSMFQLTHAGYREFGFYAKADAEKVADLPGGRARYRAVMTKVWINGEDHTKRELANDVIT